MHDLIKMSYIGLLDHEIKVLTSIFTLAPQLSDKYSLIGPEQLLDAEIILVDADSPEALRYWKRIEQQNNLVASLMLSRKGETEDGDITLQRPIRVQKLIEALEDAVDERTMTRNPDAGTNNALRIFVVDDSYPARKYMDQKLTELIDMPFKLSFASSGEEAIERTSQKTFDIVFLDVVMDGIDGYKVCKTIKATSTTYVVLLTSKKSPFDKVRGAMSGCDAYITKPPSNEKLSAEIEKYLEKRHLRTGHINRAHRAIHI